MAWMSHSIVGTSASWQLNTTVTCCSTAGSIVAPGAMRPHLHIGDVRSRYESVADLMDGSEALVVHMPGAKLPEGLHVEVVDGTACVCIM